MPLFADLPVINDDDEELTGPDFARLFGVPKPPPYRRPIDQTPDLGTPGELGPFESPTARLFGELDPEDPGLVFSLPPPPRYRARHRHPAVASPAVASPVDPYQAPPDVMLPMAPLGPGPTHPAGKAPAAPGGIADRAMRALGYGIRASQDLTDSVLPPAGAPDGPRVTPAMTPKQEYQRYLTDFATDTKRKPAPPGKQWAPLSEQEFEEQRQLGELGAHTRQHGYRAVQQQAPTQLGGGGGMKPPVVNGPPGIADRAMQALGYGIRGVQDATAAPREGVEQIGHGIEQMAEPGAAEKLRGAGKLVSGTATAASPAMLALGVGAPVEAAAYWMISKGIEKATPAIAKHFGANEEDAQEITDVAQTLPLLYGFGKMGIKRVGEARAATSAEASQRFEDAAQSRESTARAHGVDPYGFQPVDVTLNSPNGPVRAQVREIRAGTPNSKPVYQIMEDTGKGWRIGDADAIANYLRRDAVDQSWMQKLQSSAPGEFDIGEAPRIETPAQAQTVEQAKTFQGATPSPVLETPEDGLNKFKADIEQQRADGSSPDEPPVPEPPSQVERVSADTPNPPTAATPTTPESPETYDIQLQQLSDGVRKAVMFPKGSIPPTYPAGTATTHDHFGNIYVYRPDLIKATDIHAAAKSNKLPEILGSATVGMGAPDKSGTLGQPTQTVVVRDANGTEVQSTATTAESLPATIEASQHVTPPGGKVSVEPVGQVLAEREGAQAEPNPELGAPAEIGEQPQSNPADALPQMGSDMGKGIGASMRDMLWQKAQSGETTEGGQASAVLQAAKLIRDRGGLQTPEEFHAFLGDYGNVKRDGDFQQSMRDLVGKYTPQAKTAIDQIAAGLKALVDSKDPIDPEARKNLLVQALDLHTDGFNGQPLTPEEIAYWEKKITPVRDRLAKKAEKQAAQAAQSRPPANQPPIEDDRLPWYRKEEPDWWPELQAQMGERPPSWKQVVDAWEKTTGQRQILKEYVMDWADNAGPARFGRQEYEESLSGSKPEESAPKGWDSVAPQNYERHSSVDLTDEELKERSKNEPLPAPPGLPESALPAWNTVSRIIPELARRVTKAGSLSPTDPENAVINVQTGSLRVHPDRPLSEETLWHELIHLDQPEAQKGRDALDPDAFNALEIQARQGIKEALQRFHSLAAEDLAAPAEIKAEPETQEVEKTEPELHKRIFEELSKPWLSMRRAEGYLENLDEGRDDYHEERSRVEAAIEREKDEFEEILDQARKRVGDKEADHIADRVKFQTVYEEDDEPREGLEPAQFKTWSDFRRSVKQGDTVYAELGSARPVKGTIKEFHDWDKTVEVKLDQESLPGHAPILPILDQLQGSGLGSSISARIPWEHITTKAPTIIDIKADDDLGAPAQIEAPEEKPTGTATWPPLTGDGDGYVKSFEEWGNPLLYHETDLYHQQELVENMGSYEPSQYVTNDPAMALGQGKHKGVMVIIDSTGLTGKLNLQKPGLQATYQNGVAEWELRNNTATKVRSAVRAIVISPEAQQDRREWSIYRERYNRLLPAQGWTKETAEDGTVTWRHNGYADPIDLSGHPRFSAATDDAQAEPDDDLEAPASIEQPIEQPEPEKPSEELATPQALEPGGAAALVNAVYEKLRRGESLGNVTELTRLAEQHFGSGRTDGEWSVKDMFDAMEAGINKYQLLIGKALMDLPFDEGIQVVRTLMSRITSQGTRTDEQIKRQQFSTPPSQAYLATTVAAVKPSDVVMDTSAGNGGLVVLPKAIGAKVYVNEIAPRRIEMLEAAGIGKATNHDGEIIHSLLDPKIKPTVIIMNPPFSTGVKSHEGANRNVYGFNHVDSALQRLEPGGRLVAILGGGQANEPEGGASLTGGQSGRWFEKLAKTYNIRANVRINGKEYQKYGTTFATRLIVIDKTGPTSDMAGIVRGNVDTLEQAYELLRPIAESRPEVSARPGSTASTGERKPGTRVAPGEDTSVTGDRDRPSQSGGSSGDSQLPGGSSQPAGGAGGVQSGAGSQSPTRVEPDSEPAGLDETEPAGSPERDPENADDERPAQQPETVDPERLDLQATNDEDTPEEESSEAYVTYRPTLKGALHPGDIVETKTMATVPLPKITYRPALPQALIDRGGVSAVQLEGIALVGQQNEIILPNGSRSSALIGDGTGVGKGRESAGILYDNYLQGRKRLVWVSEKWDLMQAAMADFDGMGATELMRGVTKQGSKYVTGKNPAVIGLDKFKDPTKKIEHDGVLFTTYALIRSGDKKGNKRVHQLEQYLRGDDDGEGAYILFDESHNLKNAVPGATGGSRGKAKPSQIGVAVKELLERIPKLRTASLSATAATDVSNLGYLDRLGLWGPGTAFANGFRQFQAEIASGGLAAMELIAREMKALGKYISRTLSFKGVTFNEAEHKLSDDQKAIYRTSVKAWATVIERAEKTIRETTNGGSVARRNFMSQLGGTQQRFYSLLISTLKIPTAVELANKALADGKAVVISLVNTNEAAQNREMNKARKRSDEDEEEEAAELQEYDFGPKEMLKNLVETHYPVQQFMDDVDSNGNPIKVPVFRDGPNGEKIPVNNPQAEAERKALLDEIDRDLHMPANPLDELVSALGGRNKVAELTGRKKIYDRDQDKFVPRGDPNVPQEQYNLVEMAKFQNGEKLVAVLSSAAGTGISLHASNRAKNQRKRYMITLQVGWSADKAMQMLGRVHRTDQAHPPEYMLLVSDLGGEKRFIATIARRLGSLGALTKGQKNATGGSDLMSKVNFESDQGRQAAKSFYLGMMEDKPIPGTGRTGMEILHAMRMLVVDPKSGRRTVPEEDQSNITRLLNRMLALDPEVQNGCYNYYFDIFQAAVEDAISRGTLDTGVRTLPGDEISLKPQRTIATDPKTGATTHYQPLTAKIRMERVSPAELKSRLRQYATANVRIIVNDKGDKLALLQDAAPIVHADGSVEPAVYMSAPGRGRWQKIAANTLRGWKPVEQYGKEQKDKATATLESAQRNLDYYKGQQEADTKRERERLTRDAQTRLNRAETMASNYASYPELQARYTQDIAKAKEDLAKASTYEAPVDSYTTDRIKSYEEAVDQAQKTIEQKADLFEDADGWAHTRWEDLYEASPTHETREHHLITGAVMRFWNPIKEAAQLRNSIFTATDSKTGKRVVGIDIPDGEIGRLLPRIEGGHSTVNAAQLESDVLRNGLTYELETGIQVRRNKVSRESVIQLIPQTQDAARRLIALGVAYERGVTAVYYVPNKNTSVILNRVLAEFPVKTDAANRESGGGVYLGSGLGALQSVFDRGGLTAQLKNVSRFFSQVADDTKRVFAPQTRGTQARVAAGSFREMMGTLAQNEAQVHAALEDYRKAFRQMPAEHGVHGLSVIDAIEGGPQEINNLPTELRPFATTVRGLYEDRKNLLDGLGLVKHFLENYFTHMYKNPAEAEAWTANWMSKRPMAGKEAFRKKRVYPTLREALEDPDFSLVAKFDNPVDYVYAGLAQMDKSIAAHDLFNEWSDAGYLKYSLKRPDGGFSQIDDKLFTVRGPRRGAVKIDPTEPTIRPGEDPDEFESRHYAWESKMEAIDEGFIKPGDVTVYGQRTMGHYWAPDQMAQVANNYLSPGLQGKAAFDAWMKVKNGMNAINLGFSAFHGLTTTLNSSLSDVALGFQQVFAGKPARAAVSIGRGFVPFASIVQDYLRGTRLGKVWDGTAPNPTAQELAIVDALRQAGGRYKQSNDAGPLLEGLKKAWGENKVGGVVRAFNPWLWAEQSMRPIMEKLVPAAKMGAFSKMVQLEIERNPGMDVDEARKKFGEALDSIDNRMGQLNQRNMLMNNTVRAWMNAIVGRPGWNLGTIREIVGGGGDLAQNIYDLSRGKPTQLSNRTAYVLAMLLAGAVFNGVLTFMLTGDAPEGMDFIAPRDGGLTESGHESRIVLPLYLSKDLYSWATHPLRTLKAKMAQPLMVMGDLATNRDFYQRKIYGRGGIGLDSYLMHLFFPYVLSGTLQNFGRGESLGKTLLPLVGVMPASRDAGLSKAEKILDEYRQEQMASTRPAPTDHSRARSKMMMAAERGDVDKVRELAMDGIEKGILSKRDADAAMKRIDTPLIVSEVQAVNDMEVLMNAYDAATPKERDVIEDAVRAKLAKARLDPWKWTPRARKLAAKYFDVEIPGGNDASAEDLGTPASLEGTA